MPSSGSVIQSHRISPIWLIALIFTTLFSTMLPLAIANLTLMFDLNYLLKQSQCASINLVKSLFVCFLFLLKIYCFGISNCESPVVEVCRTSSDSESGYLTSPGSKTNNPTIL